MLASLRPAPCLARQSSCCRGSQGARAHAGHRESPAPASPPLSSLLRVAAAGLALAVNVAVADPVWASKPVALEDAPPVRAVLTATKGSSVTGTVTIGSAVNARGRTYTKVEVDATGLKPGQHGINIHTVGEVTCDDGQCTGPSYNPEGLPHAAPNSVKKFGASASHYVGEGSRFWRHVGDIGNITADASGAVHASFEDPMVTTGKGPFSIVGRSVVIHADADDYVNEPTAIVAYGTLKPVQ